MPSWGNDHMSLVAWDSHLYYCYPIAVLLLVLLSYTIWKMCWLYVIIALLDACHIIKYGIEKKWKEPALILFTYLLVCFYGVFMCVLCADIYAHLCEGAYAHACMYRGKDINVRCLPLLLPTLVLIQNLSVAHVLVRLAGLSAPGICYFLLPSTEVTDVGHYTCLLHRCWEFKLRPSSLHEYSTHFAIFQGLHTALSSTF